MGGLAKHSPWVNGVLLSTLSGNEIRHSIGRLPVLSGAIGIFSSLSGLTQTVLRQYSYSLVDSKIHHLGELVPTILRKADWYCC